MPIHDWTRGFPGLFSDFHQEWAPAIKHVLNRGVLPVGYYALLEQIIGGPKPDLLTLQRTDAPPVPSNGPEPGQGVALATPRVRFIETARTEDLSGRRTRVSVRHRSDDHVVAVVEIVSPGNKSSRGALRQFVDKMIELLAEGIHLMLLDLHPPGPRDPQGIHPVIWSHLRETTFTLPPDKPFTLASYAAFETKTAYIEPVAVGDELPDMPLFLDDGMYVNVPLEATYRTAFAEVPSHYQALLEAPPDAE